MLTRTASSGPELDIVRAFLDQGIYTSNADTMVSVFCEPRLETGYPDVVVVHWDRDVAESWPTCRAALTTDDVRLLHLVNSCKRVARDDLNSRSTPRETALAIERLLAANLVTASNRWVRARPLREIFAVRRIIAIEAKISDWRRGLRQAFLNTWFASESLLLLPKIPKGNHVAEHAKQMGIGIVSVGQTLSAPHVRPRRDRVPQSYGSWLFNEWVWRGFGVLRS